MMNRHVRTFVTLCLGLFLVFSMGIFLVGCVDQSQGSRSSGVSGTASDNDVSRTDSDSDAEKSGKNVDSGDSDSDSLLEISDPDEKAAVQVVKKKVEELGGDPRIVATSPATADICDRLGISESTQCAGDVQVHTGAWRDI